jgi:hypothetical protein
LTQKDTEALYPSKKPAVTAARAKEPKDFATIETTPGEFAR